MTTEFINKLLNKYFDGDTSLEEENILRGYFSSESIDAQFAQYAPLFGFIEEEKAVTISASLANKIESIAPQMPPKMSVIKGGSWWKIAASIALLIGGSWAISKHFEPKGKREIAQKGAKIIVFDENSDPELALAEIEKALNKASRKMKKGTDEATESMQKVKVATRVFNQ